MYYYQRPSGEVYFSSTEVPFSKRFNVFSKDCDQFLGFFESFDEFKSAMKNKK